ncbi:flippase-like domain-containing protein [Candidatus Igneacidithiobacillus taiwanensis]|uniref:flippase-like domain-containing protein n=2 Tax=Candidatus Igneacidithiobacillus taiwanensis TaxID=1945924 RepID=UPI00289CECE8|nr:flippase-like domain-containing protein [Candidatus Igneacidithiobacillus taiwanensis]MCE5359491.1 flippase-like domain-containing protein [Acidithiobacillus sp.]
MRAAEVSSAASKGWGSLLLIALGLIFTGYLVWYAGVGEILDIVRQGSWLLWLIVPVHVLVIGLDAMSWRWLLYGMPNRPRLGKLTWLALLREAINGLLPVARVGGELIGIRLLARMGVSTYQAAASVVVEVGLTLVSQFLFTLLGFFLLLSWSADLSLRNEVAYALLTTLPVLLLLFWLQQRYGLFSLLLRLQERLLRGRDFLAFLGNLQQLDEEIRNIFRRRWALLRANAWQLAGLFAGAGELWLSFYLLGHPVSASAAILLESLGQALRSVAFFMPGALGVQEGGFMLFGAVVGVPADLALVYSLLRRFRELFLGLPLLLSWYMMEGWNFRLLWRKKRGSQEKMV